MCFKSRWAVLHIIIVNDLLIQYLSTILPPTLFIKHADKFIAGAGAGLTAVGLTYPLDTIRARLAFQVTGEHRYRGIAHAAVTIFKDVMLTYN